VPAPVAKQYAIPVSVYYFNMRLYVKCSKYVLTYYQLQINHRVMFDHHSRSISVISKGAYALLTRGLSLFTSVQYLWNLAMFGCSSSIRLSNTCFSFSCQNPTKHQQYLTILTEQRWSTITKTL